MFNRLFKRQSQGAETGNGRSHLIELHQVSKFFHVGSGDFVALDNVDFFVDKGEYVAVMGKSGSGKSTLVNMISGIDRPSSGEIIVAGTNLNQLKEGEMAVWRGQHVGLIFQFFQLLPTLSVIENLMVAMDFCHTYPRGQRESRALALLEQVGLTHQAHSLPLSISGGEQQRVAIARALATNPLLLLADEPTGNLDSGAADDVVALFEELVDQGKTILMVTHDDELASRAKRIITLSDGKIVDDIRRDNFTRRRSDPAALDPVNYN
jgi:putative ABC transport system ATP-binding protein